jgi:hypothetical protein
MVIFGLLSFLGEIQPKNDHFDQSSQKSSFNKQASKGIQKIVNLETIGNMR